MDAIEYPQDTKTKWASLVQEPLAWTIQEVPSSRWVDRTANQGFIKRAHQRHVTSGAAYLSLSLWKSRRL